MNKFVLTFLAIFLIGFASSVCTSSQININTASTLQLNKLYGVGEVKAQYIVEARPYSSVDELLKAKGIGKKTLEKIKEEGLACVETTKENASNETFKNNSNTQKTEKIKDNQYETNFSAQNKKIPKEKSSSSSPVDLTPKDIKSSEALSSQDKTDYSKYLFLVFCVVLLSLYILKFNKRKLRKRKNEWK